MKRKTVFKPYTIFFIVILLLSIIGAVSWAGDGAMVFRSPSYPYRVLMWGDDHGSGYTVAVALRDNFAPYPAEPTLDDALEIFLPEAARHFTPFPFIPDLYNLKGDDVPVAVYDLPEDVVFDAYEWGYEEDLAEDIVAIGLVKVHWNGKSYKSVSYSAIGPVNLMDGGEALLVATGHELYKNGVFLRAHEKVDLH
jgi:hypothetical protein